jgi:agmatinase
MPSPDPFPTLGTRSNFLAIGKEISSFADSRIVVLPAPYEHTVTYGRGAARGPAGILAASAFVEFYDEELDRELCRTAGIATLRPLAFGKRVHRKAVDIVRDSVAALLERNKFVVTLGGEHTITLGCVEACAARYPDLSILQIDAHSDLRDQYQGTPFSHASVMARVCEVIDPCRVVQVGIRAQCIEEARFIRERGVHTLYAHQIRSWGSAGETGRWQEAAVGHLGDHVYVTFDVDGLDPSIMPSTGTPEPNGLHWAETMTLLRLVAERKAIVSCDVVELAPARAVPHADLTAAKLTYKLMNYAALRD